MNPTDIHGTIAEWIAAGEAGGLNESERAELRAHLDACPACRGQHRESVLAAEMTAAALSGDRPGKDFEDRMVAAFRKEAGGSARGVAAPRPRRWLRFAATSIAASVALVALGILSMPAHFGAHAPDEMNSAKKMSVGFAGDSAPKGAAEYAEQDQYARPSRVLAQGGEQGGRLGVLHREMEALELQEELEANLGFRQKKLQNAGARPAADPARHVAGLLVAEESAKPADGRSGGRFGRDEARDGYFGPTDGGRGLGGEDYAPIRENGFVPVSKDARSTFSIDVDTASYANVRRYLQQGMLPPPDAVRVEELVNYFQYDYAGPDGADPFAVHLEVSRCPWNLQHRLVRVGLKGRTIPRDARPPSNLVFLVDVSGSMRPENKLPLLQRSMGMLVEQLTEDDHVGIVVYAGEARVVLDSTDCGRKERIQEAIASLSAGGSTNGGAGIHMAYEMAERRFVKGGVNRVLLATDGDFNVGVTGRESLVDIVTEWKRKGIALTVLGFGTGNLKDATLEAIADKGDGAYAYIDSEREAKKVLVDGLSGTLVTIAKDVKIQIEFNPVAVGSWRLIGYENRVMAHRDFRDDTKDAGEIGAGHAVTALYEIVPAGLATEEVTEPLKYQDRGPRPTKAAFSGDLLTLSLNFKRPGDETSTERAFSVVDSSHPFALASADFRFAAMVAGFGMILRGSAHKGGASLEGIAELASEGIGEDPDGHRAEFVRLVETARRLMR